MRQTIPASAPTALVPLATLDDLKADLAITDTSQDSRLSGILLEASSMALAFVGRAIMRADWRDLITVVPGQSPPSLVLGRWPVVAIKALSVAQEVWSADQLKSLNTDPDTGLIYPPDSSMTLWPPGEYVITYTAGYAALGGNDPVTVPPDIQRAVRQVANSLWNSTGRDVLLKSETEQGVGSASWSSSAPGLGGMPQSSADLLMRYRRKGPR